MVFSSVLLAGSFFLQTNVFASVVNIQARQSDTLPTGWTFKGCYVDSIYSRTLRTASTTSVDNMTISFCVDFCNQGNYQFAGLEFGRECYCDNTIRSPAFAEPTTDCNMPCTGDSTTMCGAPDRLSVYSAPAVPPATQPTAPSLPRAFAAGPPGTYQYQGCFVDPINPRGLQHQFSVSGGNTPNGCANICKANGYRVMGLENGGECWCDDFMPFGDTVSDSSCNTACTGDSKNACGGPGLLQLYGDITNILTGIPSSGQCMADGRESLAATSISPFRLRGVTDEGDIINVGLMQLNPGASTEQIFILTSNFGGEFVLQNNRLIPIYLGGNPVTIPAAVGESQFFVASGSEQPVDDYCAGFLGTNNLPFYGFPVLDQIDRGNGWGLCLNNTPAANGRRDAIYAPVQNHPHYDFFSCIFVKLQMVS